MKDQLREIKEQALREIESAQGLRELEEFRIAFLGKKGRITSLMKAL
ncbi:MAG: phenylalanine--tRNA ligase subunit alpha, partial [Deltaproteobacteria bacterium]|nr:phenylalanine--tRNA ligase subunit alpha [Deltaproteobacteria bacterium]